jgi:Carboxypeptidase regulatory-like domain
MRKQIMRSAKTTSSTIFVVAAFLLLFAASVLGQSFRGSIRGVVTDPSGGVLVNAKVTAKNINTGLQREATTGPDGSYVIAELPAGEYTVTAQAAQLSPAAQNVQVNVGLDTTANFDLSKIEKHAEAITVQEEAPLVESTRDVLGEVVDRRLVNDLPLNGRDFGKLVALVPGATVEPSGVAAIQSGFGQFAINGNRDRSNNYTLDGTDNNDPFFNNSAFNQVGIGGAPASLLPIDAIQEFNLESQFAAEYGRNSGSVVNIVTKSGTNRIHGSAFEFLRNDVFDARNFFNRSTDQAGDHIPQSEFRNNQFGASFGGPIIKDKTFVFAAYEGQRERVTSDFTFLVPTQQQIADAQAISLAGTVGPPVVSVPPNPALTSILAQFPTATGFNSNTGTGTVVGGVHDTNSLDTFIVKVDHQLTGSESLSGRYAFASDQQQFPLGGLGFGAGSRFQQFSQTSPTRVQLVSASLLTTLSANRINEIRFGYSRYRTSFASLDANVDYSSPTLNWGTGKLGLPEIDFGGTFDNLGASAFSIPRGRTSQTFQILDNFTWVKGRHTMKFGGEYRRVAIDSFNDNLERGLFSFGPENTGNLVACQSPNPPLACTANNNQGDPAVLTLVAYYLGDTFPSADAGNTQRTTYNNGLSFFAQDDFRATRKFTVNLGMRWEYFGPLSEAHNLLSNLGADGNLALVGTDGLKGAYNRDLNNFGPRLGFAWNALPKTVIRGAYGIYYDYIPQDLLIANFTNSAGLATNPIGPQAVVSLANNYDPTAFNGTNPGGPVFSLPTPPYPPSGSDIFFTPRNLVTPYVQNWNFNVEQELRQGVALQLGYVGSKGTKLVRLRDANQPDVNGNRPNTNYGFMDEFATISGSTYHALQATLRTRSWHGVSGFTGYTYSKSLDDASDGIDFNFATVALPQDSNNLRAEHGPSNFDSRHRFTAAFTYDLPHFGWENRWTRGWQVNTIVSAQSGRPVPLVASNDTSGFGFPTPSNFHQRPNVVPGVNPINSDWRSAPDSIGYLNGNAFAQPPVGTFGDLGRNEIYGPSYANVDLAILKNTLISERFNLQTRAEFFNILNHPNFALPNFFINPGATGQGVITQTPDVAQTNPGLGGGGPRVIQLALKLIF